MKKMSCGIASSDVAAYRLPRKHGYRNPLPLKSPDRVRGLAGYVDRAELPSFGRPAVVAKMRAGVRRGASPGDGVFGPVSPVRPLTRPNRMTVSPGTRAGRQAFEPSVGGPRSSATIMSMQDIAIPPDCTTSESSTATVVRMWSAVRRPETPSASSPRCGPRHDSLTWPIRIASPWCRNCPPSARWCGF